MRSPIVSVSSLPYLNEAISPVSMRATWSVTRHGRSINYTAPTWREKIPRQWSKPHLRVMGVLAKNQIPFLTEKETACTDCGNSLCHHKHIVDILLVQNPVIIEIHRPHNDEYEQTIRTRCLTRSGYTVITLSDADANRQPERILSLLTPYL